MAGRRGAVGSGPGWRARVRLLPRSTRLFGLVLLACAAAPGAARLYAAVGEGPFATVLGEHLAIVPAGALALACVAVLAAEPPRAGSPAAYARQLRDRFLELQSDFDAGFRRRPGEGKENGDDVQHPSEP